MEFRIMRIMLLAAAAVILSVLYSCSEDTSGRYDGLKSELIIDSVSVCIVRAPHPGDGSPAGRVVWDVYYKLGGNPGAVSKVQIYLSPPGRYTYTLEYNSIYDHEPLPVDTQLELHDDLWFACDYTDYDSIWIYFAVEAAFWREIESRIQDNTVILPRGDDRWFKNMKIDVRDE